MSNQYIEKTLIIFFSLISILLIFFISIYQIIPNYVHRGMTDFVFDNTLAVSIFFLIINFFIFCLTNLNKSEGIILTVIIFFSSIWFLCFNSISNLSSTKHVLFVSILFLFPISLLSLSSNYLNINYRLNFLKHGLIKIRMEYVILLILFFVSYKMYNLLGLDFSTETIYERRLAGREKITFSLGYLFNMCINGLAPILAFISFYNKRYIFLLPCLAFVILSYGFVGNKSPIIFIFIMSFLGIYYSIFKKNLLVTIIFLMTSIFVISFVEYLIVGNSLIATYFIRRAILVYAQLNILFTDFMFNYENFNEIFWFGSQYKTEVNYLIGQIYFQSNDMNASTTSFVIEFVRRGFIGYVFNIFFLLLISSFYSYMYKISDNKVWLGTSFLYAVLMLQQGFTTAFVSSGIGLITVLLCLFNSKKIKIIKKKDIK